MLGRLCVSRTHSDLIESYSTKGNWVSDRRNMADWHDYVSLLPTMAAIVNSVIAVMIAQIVHQNQRAKIALVLLAWLIAGSAIAITISGQHDIISAREGERSRDTRIREMLGDFISHGQSLMSAFSNPKAAPHVAEANKWLSDTSDFLLKNLGKSYVTRFDNPSGTPIENVITPGITTDNQTNWRIVNQHVFRLEQFSEELPH